MKKSMFLTPIVLLAALALNGCSSQPKETGAQPNDKPENHQPVTITVGINATGYLNEEEFQRYITDPVKKKYPWITVQRVPYQNGVGLPELVVSGETPDLVVVNNITTAILTVKDLDLVTPLTDLIKKHQLDLNRFDPETLDAIKTALNMSELPGLPYTRHFSALYYNKDIFDRFGVPYPKDGMTWDDTYELAKKVTRLEGNTQYRGLEPNVFERPFSQLSLPYVDSKTNKSLVNSDNFKRAMEFMVKVHSIPGNAQITFHSAANDLFAKNRTLAMLASNNIIFDGNLYKVPDLNWDMVSYPTWAEAPGKGLRTDEHILMITKTSKNKDDAFRVISTVVSDDVQMDFSKQGRFSVLTNQKINEAFGSNMDFMKGKNVQAIYKTKPAKVASPTIYDALSANTLNNTMKDIVSKGIDINTALRQAEESINKQIQEKMAGGK